MREFFAAKATTSIKVQMFHTVDKWSNVNAGSFGTFKQGTQEYDMSQKCDKFINDHLEKDLKSIIPMKWEGMKSTEKQIKKFYDPLYNGIVKFLGTDKFNDFFEGRFDVSKINDNGEYEGFGNFGTCHYVLNLNEALHCVDDKMAKLEGDDTLRKRVNKAFQDFQNGTGGDKSIDNLYGFMNDFVDELGGTTEQIQDKNADDAWQSIGSPVMSKGGYNCYCVRRWKDLNAVASFTNWCVAQNGHSGQNYFDGCGDEKSPDGYIYPNYDANGNPTKHIGNKRNAYYLICEGRKPVALFNISTKKHGLCQFKNVGDHQFSMDRPSSKDVIELADELRKHLGSKDYSGDFGIFSEYKEQGDDFEPKLDYSMLKLEKDPSLFHIKGFRDELVKRLENGSCWDIIEKNPSFLEHPEIRGVLLNGLKNRYCSDIFKKNPIPFMKIPEIKKSILDGLKGDNDFCWSIVEKNLAMIEAFSEVKTIFLEALKDAKCWYIVQRNPSLIDKIPEIKDILLNSLDKRFCWDCVENKASLIEIPEIKKALVQNLKERRYWNVVESNPSIIDKYPEINDVFMEKLKEGNCWYVVETNPYLLDRPDIKALLPEGLKSGRCWDIVWEDKSILDGMTDDDINKFVPEQLKDGNDVCLSLLIGRAGFFDNPDNKNAFVEGLRRGNYWKFVEKNTSLIDSIPEVNAVLMEKLKKGRCWEVINNNLSLLDNQDIQKFFVDNLKDDEANCWKIVSDNPSLIDSIPVVRSVLKDKLEEGYGWDIVTRKPSIIDNPDFSDILLDGLQKGYCVDIFKNHPAPFMKIPEIKSLVLRRLENGKGWDLVGDHPVSFVKVPEIKKLLLEELRAGSCWSMVEKFSALLEEPEIMVLFAKRLGEGQGWVLVKNSPHLLKYPQIQDALAKMLDNGTHWEIFTENPSLVDNPKIKAVFLKKLKNEKHWSIVQKNPSLIDKIPEIKGMLSIGLNLGYCWNIVNDNPSIVSENKDVMNVLLDKLKANQSDVLMEHPSFLEIPEVKKIFSKKIENGDGFKVVGEHPSLFENPDYKNSIVEGLRHGYGWIMLRINPRILEKALKVPEIKEVLMEKLQGGNCWDVIEDNPDIFEQFKTAENVLVERLKKGMGWRIVEKNPSIVREFPEIRNEMMEKIKRGVCWRVMIKTPSLLEEFPEIKASALEGLKNGYGWDYAKEIPSLLDAPEACELLVEGLKDKRISPYFIKGISNVKLLKKILDANSTDGNVRMFVLQNDNKNTDEGKLYKLCKEFASKDYRFLDEFFKRYHAMSDSESFQNDFWNYVEKSNYLFEVIRDYYDVIPQKWMERFAQSSDRDVNWIANKLKKPSLPESEKKASRIARRICLPDIIAERIVLGK